MNRFLLLVLLIFGFTNSYALQSLSEEVYDAFFKQDLKQLHILYGKSTDKERQAIEKALYSHMINLDNFTYENLRDAQSGTDDGFNKILQRHINVKELEILKEISTKTPEDLKTYTSKYPKRANLAVDYLNSVILNNLDSISYKELDYLNRILTNPELKTQLTSRSSERKIMVREAISAYSNLEYKNIVLLKDLLDLATLQYFNTKYKTIARAYSSIGIVPDDPEEIDNQFRRIVKAAFSSKELNSILNNIITKYCSTINSARANYALNADITGYPVMKLSIPNLSGLTYMADYSILSKIPQARMDFTESRETAGTVASIASWFVGSLASTIGQGLYDMYAVEKLADKEIATREEIMTHAYEQLKNKINEYINNISQHITNQAFDDYNKFINYVTNYN